MSNNEYIFNFHILAWRYCQEFSTYLPRISTNLVIWGCFLAKFCQSAWFFLFGAAPAANIAPGTSINEYYMQRQDLMRPSWCDLRYSSRITTQCYRNNQGLLTICCLRSVALGRDSAQKPQMTPRQSHKILSAYSTHYWMSLVWYLLPVPPWTDKYMPIGKI